MRAVSFLFIALLALACNNDAADKKAEASDVAALPGAVTKITWLDSTKNMGKITEGEKVEIAFRFVNSGDKPLVIQSVGVSCGCTVAEKPGELFPPGKEGVIKAIFDSKGRLGANHKTVTVYANTEQPMHPLSFEVEVMPANK
jgi:hypothetical protein